MTPTEDEMAESLLPDPGQLRSAVRTRYARLAREAQAGETVTDCDAETFTAGAFGAAGYPDADGLPDGAVRASLGCGNPVAVADLRPGETVLDLGSGGGIDVLLSARRVGPHGKAYGLDMTAEMLELARANAREAGADNVEFLHGHIEDIPLPDRGRCAVGPSGGHRQDPALVTGQAYPAVLGLPFGLLRPGASLSRWFAAVPSKSGRWLAVACPYASTGSVRLSAPRRRSGPEQVLSGWVGGDEYGGLRGVSWPSVGTAPLSRGQYKYFSCGQHPVGLVG